MSKLAVWWLRLGIGIERFQPGHPQQNERQERMHVTLKKEATKPAAANFLQQQARFDKFIDVCNNERTHEALDMKCPAEVYQPSTRPYTRLPDIDYPFHDKTIVVTRCGRICLGKKKSMSARSLLVKLWASKKFMTRVMREWVTEKNKPYLVFLASPPKVAAKLSAFYLYTFLHPKTYTN